MPRKDQSEQKRGQPQQERGQPQQERGQPQQEQGQPQQERGQPQQERGQPKRQRDQAHQQSGQTQPSLQQRYQAQIQAPDQQGGQAQQLVDAHGVIEEVDRLASAVADLSGCGLITEDESTAVLVPAELTNGRSQTDILTSFFRRLNTFSTHALTSTAQCELVGYAVGVITYYRARNRWVQGQQQERVQAPCARQQQDQDRQQQRDQASNVQLRQGQLSAAQQRGQAPQHQHRRAVPREEPDDCQVEGSLPQRQQVKHQLAQRQRKQ
jgi:hypothetical protein